MQNNSRTQVLCLAGADLQLYLVLFPFSCSRYFLHRSLQVIQPRGTGPRAEACLFFVAGLYSAEEPRLSIECAQGGFFMYLRTQLRAVIVKSSLPHTSSKSNAGTQDVSLASAFDFRRPVRR